MLLMVIISRTALFLSNVTHVVRETFSATKMIEKNVPSMWTQKECSICSCDYDSKKVYSSNINILDGLLLSASDFTNEQVNVFKIIEIPESIRCVNLIYYNSLSFLYSLYQNSSESVIDPNYFLNFPSLQEMCGNMRLLHQFVCIITNLGCLYCIRYYLEAKGKQSEQVLHSSALK